MNCNNSNDGTHDLCVQMPSLHNPRSQNAGVIRDPYIPSDSYTDTDLAVEMNAMSFAERQAVEEDIHGVADAIEETPEFIAHSVEAMIQAFQRLNSQQRQALDRAFFLRPALSQDQSFHLMFLRARRFNAHKAALAMAAYFRAKRDLFGDDLLVQRITWNDLTEKDKVVFRSGAYQLFPNHDIGGRGVAVACMSHFDLQDNIRSVCRCIWYVISAVEDDPVMQQKGIVTVVYFGGQWKSSPLHFIRLGTGFPMDAIPIHLVSHHFLCVDTSSNDVIPRVRNLLAKDSRTRVRLHFGSSLELEYAMRTFGIDISRQLFQDDKGDEQSIEKDIQRRQQLDDEWRRSEAPYRESTSPVALLPNPQDILSGRSKLVTTWSGNVMYHKLIEKHVHRYLDAQDGGLDRIDKTLISVDILLLLRNQYQSRFLARENATWVVIDDSDAQKKISRSLRLLAREIGHRLG